MYQARLDLLREALPYIQRFKGKTFVVKLSGKVTDERENLESLAEELASSVTRRPLIIVCSTPNCTASSFNCLPPPCTTQDAMPT